ncbi:MAG: hypothetical protein M3Y50_12425 [Acidobacteriota bacterium]|nr:hypothetical protein [Acidobacteriota bacterium]
MNTPRFLPVLAVVSGLLLPGQRAHAEGPVNPIFSGKKVLLVAATSSETAPVDANIKKHFESLGMVVTMVPDINPPSATGYDLVFLASDVKAKTVTNSYRSTTVPVFTMKPWLLDFLGMTGYEPQKDYGEDTKVEQSFLWLVNAPNPIQAGFPNGMFMPMKHAIKTYNWGLATPSAQVIAFLPGEPTKSIVFGYDKGVYMDHEFTAPARRIFFGLAPDGFDVLIPDGIKLFDSCAAWALSGKKER